MSRLHLSSKSITGVFEDMEILDELVYGIMWVKVSFRIFCESFVKIWHQEPCQDYVFILVYFGAHKQTHGKCLLFILIILKYGFKNFSNVEGIKWDGSLDAPSTIIESLWCEVFEQS